MATRLLTPNERAQLAAGVLCGHCGKPITTCLSIDSPEGEILPADTIPVLLNAINVLVERVAGSHCTKGCFWPDRECLRCMTLREFGYDPKTFAPLEEPRCSDYSPVDLIEDRLRCQLFAGHDGVHRWNGRGGSVTWSTLVSGVESNA